MFLPPNYDASCIITNNPDACFPYVKKVKERVKRWILNCTPNDEKLTQIDRVGH
jgi:hypothetical protein